MIRILIVDDEPLVRLGMKSIIGWNENGYSIVGEAGNGAQGIEMIFELNPDIVLVDIMMPQMNGIELIAKAKEKGYKGKFIVLSCASEIEYLQQAIRLGVSRYILKSAVMPQEILSTVNEVSNEIQKGRVFSEDFGNEYTSLNDNFAMNEFLNLVFKGVINSHVTISEKMNAFGFDKTKAAFLHVYRIREQHESQKSKLYKIAAIGKSLLEGNFGSCFVNFEDYLIIVVQTESEKKSNEFSFRLKASAKQYFGTKLTVASKEIDVELWDIYEKYVAAKKELTQNFFYAEGTAGGGTKPKPLIPSTEFASYEKLSSTLEIVKNMMVQSSAISENEAKKVYAGAIEYVVLMYEIAWDTVLPKDVPEVSALAYLNMLDSFQQVHDETLGILRKCYVLAEQKGYKEYDDELTDTIVRYIYNHCNARINLKDVADYVHFSVDYTCKYFKKKTHTNLTDFILKLKIYKSQADLFERKSISEVAEMYGFSSDSHYVKTFKRYQGVTPGAFVKNNSAR